MGNNSNNYSKKHNIIFILVDDMGWMDMGCYGSEFYETPNLDKLAAEGMLFTDAYAACPVCSPTRASIMSGKYPATLGVTDWIGGETVKPFKLKVIEAPYIDHLPLEEKSIARALKEGGYQTWHIGKWHLGDKPYYPEHHGFDINIGGCSWGAPNGVNGYFSPWGIETLTDGAVGEYLDDRLTDEAIKLIQNNGDKPFYMNLCFYLVHVPIQAKEEIIRKYEEKAKTKGFDNIEVLIEEDYDPRDPKKNKLVTHRIIQSDPVYAAMIQILDENIGRLMQALEDAGLKDDTIVFFTSDNGGLSTGNKAPTSNLPLSRGKGWMYEGGTREPLIIRCPSVVGSGSICNEPVTSPDFYPTLLEMAGLPLIPEQHIDGISLLPLLQGEGKLNRDAIFWHYPHYGNQGGRPGSSIRMSDYKLIEFHEDGHLELYNLKEDIAEENNLIFQEPERTRRMHDKLIAWRESIEAKMPLENSDWPI